MAKLNKFTNDERLILSLVLSNNALMNKVVDLTGDDECKLSSSLAIATGKFSAIMSNEEARNYIDDFRNAHNEAHQAIMKNNLANSN